MLVQAISTMGSAVYVATTVAVVAAAYVASFYSNAAANLWFKTRLFATGAAQMVLSQDRKWEKQPDSDLIKNAPDLQTKQVIFIRHGESDWNEVRNDFIYLHRPAPCVPPQQSGLY